MAGGEVVSVTMDGLEELKSKLKSENAGPPARRFLERCGGSVVQKAKPLTPVNVGTLKRSITHVVSASLPIPQYVEVGTNVKYAPYVHKGRPPGKWPPDGPIRYWVMRKNKGLQGDALDTATWAVRAKIGRKGIEPKPFLTDGLQAAMPSLQGHVSTLAKELEKALS